MLFLRSVSRILILLSCVSSVQVFAMRRRLGKTECECGKSYTNTCKGWRDHKKSDKHQKYELKKQEKINQDYKDAARLEEEVNRKYKSNVMYLREFPWDLHKHIIQEKCFESRRLKMLNVLEGMGTGSRGVFEPNAEELKAHAAYKFFQQAGDGTVCMLYGRLGKCKFTVPCSTAKKSYGCRNVCTRCRKTSIYKTEYYLELLSVLEKRLKLTGDRKTPYQKRKKRCKIKMAEIEVVMKNTKEAYTEYKDHTYECVEMVERGGGRRYCYCGETFTDDDGIEKKNLCDRGTDLYTIWRISLMQWGQQCHVDLHVKTWQNQCKAEINQMKDLQVKLTKTYDEASERMSEIQNDVDDDTVECAWSRQRISDATSIGSSGAAPEDATWVSSDESSGPGNGI